MASTAAQLVDSVFPELPVRQWLLSLPHDIRFALGYDPQLLSKRRRCFLRKLMSFLPSVKVLASVGQGHVQPNSEPRQLTDLGVLTQCNNAGQPGSCAVPCRARVRSDRSL